MKIDMNKVLETDAWRKVVRELRPKTCDGAPPLRKYLSVEVETKGVNAETGMETFRFIASTGAVDREGDILFPDGWELENYLNNPVILWAHESWSYPIGRAVKVNQKKKQLEIDIEFTPEDVNPEGYRVYKLVKAGFVKAVSVGFHPRKWVWNDEHNGYDFETNELLELSVVPVPANQEALLAAGLDTTTAKWYGGMCKGAAAAVVLQTIIKTAMDYNNTKDTVIGGETHNATAPPAVQPLETITSTGNDADAPPTNDKELDMKELEKLEKSMEALTELVTGLPTALKDAFVEALAETQTEPVVDDPVDDPDAVADPVVDDPAPEGDGEGEGDATDLDNADGDDDLIEIEGLTDDGLRGMVVEAIDAAETATSGKLPD